MAAAPSFIGDELPAVTEPSDRKTGFNVASVSGVLPGRMHSSRSRSTPGTATISWSNRPFTHASAARRCEAAANSSCSPRVIAYLSARISAPSPRATVQSFGICGLTMRQPRAEFHSCSWLVGKPLAGLSNTHGARVMLSTPLAMVMSASPTSTVRDALNSASMPLPHKRLTVAPGTVTGNPARSDAIRATLRLSSPAPLASPA